MSTAPALRLEDFAGHTQGPFTVVPFHPCNDAARARGDVAGWDIMDAARLRIECFDDKDSAQARCDELNHQPEGGL